MLQSGEIVSERYEIVRVLGTGATATTYLANDVVAESHFVLKEIKNPELRSRLSRAEFRSLKDLYHPNLPRVYDIYPANDPFHLKLEYVFGSSLRDEREQYSGNVDTCITIGSEVLRALEYLAERGLIHRDVSPANILIPDENRGSVRLIDFGLAAQAEDAISSVGTPPYRAPEVEKTPPRWSSQCDLYSLGVVLFELLTGRLPYRVDNNQRFKEQLVSPTYAELQQYGDSVLSVLLTACEPDPTRRFQTAREFLLALERSASSEKFACDGEALVNPFVNELRQTYRNSRIGNPNNRGLESSFARDTYVDTRLDTELLPSIVDGHFSLVLLSGNPGDGKTAFLQRLEARLRELGGKVLREDQSGWSLGYAGNTFAGLFDASESHEGQSADDLMHETLRPLAGATRPTTKFTAIVAVNDGRLWSFFERYGQLKYRWIWEHLRPQLEGVVGVRDGVLLVDLKRRSAVGFDASRPSLFNGIFDHFASSRHWAICQGCKARRECPMFLNASTLHDHNIAPTVRSQLNQLLLSVHLRKERHPTIRDIRSALAYVITNDLGCEEVHKLREVGESPLAGSERLYFNSLFNGTGSPDLLLDEWEQIDPAATANPRLARFLYFQRNKDQAEAVESLFAPGATRSALPLPCDDTRSRIVTLVRRYYLEGSDPPQRGMPDRSALLPFRYFTKFVRILTQAESAAESGQQILRGISRADGVPLEAIRGGLALRLSDNGEGSLIVVKRFSADEFRVVVSVDDLPGVETIPDSIILEHVRGSPKLEIGLDLFEFLMRAADGCLPGPEEQRALAEDISIFKSQLLARPTQEVFLFELGGARHRVSIRDGALVREEVAS